ncbi:fibropellin-3-like [Branchiostoma floridae]|uniref:Fibropellin-3-like n=1 Tax=Branchiostoma floridae TaxID=7739 RepID=A0A9J7MZN2_BRAFL|nr:fibropellin-3-like [Branchiostoma floridae]
MACANMKGKLVDIHDATDQQILLSYIQGADFSYWTAIKSRTPDLFHPDGSSFSVLSPWMSDYPYAPGDVCVLLDSSSGYRGEFHTCAEHQNYICESDIDLCGPTECQNGGNCIACFSDFSMCRCHPGYTGAFCEIDIDECSSSPCQNGGTCVDGVNAFSCNCVRGYTGVFCETDIDWCDPDPCPSGWMCVDGVPGFHCDAPMRVGTTSTFCSSFPCGPGWICAEKDQNGYSCTRE